MNANHLNIYSVKRNHRFNYVISELFERRMGLKVAVFTNLEEFIKQVGPRFNYSHQSIKDVPQIIPAKLLFEKRIQEQDLDINK